MAIFAVTYGFIPDSDARDRVRPEHREFLHDQDGLLLSGPCEGDAALIIFEAKSTEEVEEILDDDPYFEAGLISERTIVEWTPVSGSWRDLVGL
jgi:uncharacterized protein YciI